MFQKMKNHILKKRMLLMKEMSISIDTIQEIDRQIEQWNKINRTGWNNQHIETIKQNLKSIKQIIQNEMFKTYLSDLKLQKK